MGCHAAKSMGPLNTAGVWGSGPSRIRMQKNVEFEFDWHLPVVAMFYTLSRLGKLFEHWLFV